MMTKDLITQTQNQSLQKWQNTEKNSLIIYKKINDGDFRISNELITVNTSHLECIIQDKNEWPEISFFSRRHPGSLWRDPGEGSRERLLAIFTAGSFSPAGCCEICCFSCALCCSLVIIDFQQRSLAQKQSN